MATAGLSSFDPRTALAAGEGKFVKGEFKLRITPTSLDLGRGKPVRVKQGQRVLFRLLNASATDEVRVALAGHQFLIIAMDGNPVPRSQTLDMLYLDIGERIDAVVEMKNPGVWVFAWSSGTAKSTARIIFTQPEVPNAA
jgi:FtsP/CotA-like multicopper oxidase with cupredoxin domain